MRITLQVITPRIVLSYPLSRTGQPGGFAVEAAMTIPVFFSFGKIPAIKITERPCSSA